MVTHQRRWFTQKNINLDLLYINGTIHATQLIAINKTIALKHFLNNRR
jgi:hypothetical protein